MVRERFPGSLALPEQGNDLIDLGGRHIITENPHGRGLLREQKVHFLEAFDLGLDNRLLHRPLARCIRRIDGGQQHHDQDDNCQNPHTRSDNPANRPKAAHPPLVDHLERLRLVGFRWRTFAKGDLAGNFLRGRTQPDHFAFELLHFKALRGVRGLSPRQIGINPQPDLVGCRRGSCIVRSRDPPGWQDGVRPAGGLGGDTLRIAPAIIW